MIIFCCDDLFADFKNEVKMWFNVLLPKMEKYLYGKGGPIIMVQVKYRI